MLSSARSCSTHIATVGGDGGCGDERKTSRLICIGSFDCMSVCVAHAAAAAAAHAAAAAAVVVACDHDAEFESSNAAAANLAFPRSTRRRRMRRARGGTKLSLGMVRRGEPSVARKMAARAFCSLHSASRLIMCSQWSVLRPPSSTAPVSSRRCRFGRSAGSFQAFHCSASFWAR